MDPTIEALTIHPAAWAALFQGLAEGIAYSLAIVASGLVASTALLGRISQPPRADEAPHASGTSVPALIVQRRTQATRRRPHHGCQRVA